MSSGRADAALRPPDYALLGLLAISPMSGYDIRQMIDRSIAHFWSESFGSIYPALGRLAADGFVRRVAGSGAGTRGKQLYALTPAGRKELARWLRTPPRPDARPRSPLLLKLFFGRMADAADLIRMLQDYRRSQDRALEGLRALEAEIAADPAGADAFFWQLTVRRGVLVADARLAWAKESLQAIEVRARRNGPWRAPKQRKSP